MKAGIIKNMTEKSQHPPGNQQISVSEESDRISSLNPDSSHSKRSYFDLIKLLRPHQWTKNLFCLAGVIFGGRLFQPHAIALAVVTVILFSIMASAVYIFNDIQDFERDRRHPKKRFRPIASGKVSIKTAVLIALFFATLSLVSAYHLGVPTFTCIVLYGINNIIYSLALKNVPLFDVGCIAFGFVLRLLAGIYALDDIPTAWITLCTFSLTLFLGFAKRRTELLALLSHPMHQQLRDYQENLSVQNPQPDYLKLFYQRGHVNKQRPVLAQYTLPFLDSLLNSTATLTLMCYALFTIASGKNPSLVITVPIVYYAVMHYKWMVTVLAIGEEPDRILLEDNVTKLSVIIWFITYLGIVYFDIRLFI